MTIAESVVKEYLERGYSLESLRLLAESREQPLGGEMLAVIETLAAKGGIPATAEDSGPCETAAYPVTRGEEDAVFFIASDDDAVGEDGAVDFDVMADTASREESVAEVLISKAVATEPTEPAQPDAVEAGCDSNDPGIWSRLWSKVSGASEAPALAPSVLGRSSGEPTFEGDAAGTQVPAEDGGHSVRAMETSASDAFCEAVAARMESVSDAVVEVSEHQASERDCFVDVERNMDAEGDPVAEMEMGEAAPLSATADENAGAASDAVVADEEASPTGEMAVTVEPQPFADDIAAQAEISADYIPGSVSDLYDGSESAETAPLAEASPVKANNAPAMQDATSGEGPREPLSVIEAEKRRLDEAQAAIAAAQETTSEFPVAEMAAAEAVVPAVPESGRPVENRQESRRERRRRERAAKKKQKRGKKASAPVELPEIVLTRSEGTETMSVAEEVGPCAPGLSAERDTGASVAEGAAPVPEFESELPAVATATSEMDESAQESGAGAAPCMSEPMSLLTPNDVIEDDSQIAEDSSVASAAAPAPEDEAVDAGAAAPEEQAKVAAPLCLVGDGEKDAVAGSDAASEDGSVDFADEPALFFSGNDHLMIIAGGGVTEEEYADLATDGFASESASEEDSANAAEMEPVANNVILFSEKFPVFAGICADEVEFLDDEEGGADADSYRTVLHMLPSVEAGVSEEAGSVSKCEDGPADGQAVATLTGMPSRPLLESLPDGELGDLEYAGPGHTRLDDDAKRALVRAMLGSCPVEECLTEMTAEAGDGHVIVAQEPEPEPDDSLEREAAVREEMEREYQVRLDEFAARLLDVQGVAAASEAKVREKKAELDAKGAIIEEMQKRLDEEVSSGRKMAANLIAAKAETKAREDDLERFNGMQDEHQRLYKEFEDLRRAYNEVVADVMPGLQNERDDLAITVERQSVNEKKLRSSLGSARKRLAVGYSLAGAACLALVALPVSNWLKSGETDKQIAMEHQKVTELQDTLQREVQQNIHSQTTIVELENKIKMARAQIEDLQGKNLELARVNSLASTTQSQGLAVFRPSESASSGTPTRASDMALQATTQPGGRLHVNEIRDPAGSIEQLASMNRQQRSQPNTQMARAPQSSTRPIAMSAVARAEPRQGNGLRPTSAAAASAVSPAPRQSGTAGAQRQRGGTPSARPGEVLAKVKKGEGVAQVVYRELGTWDPEVIAWVIRENGITNDRRGNPRIHPDQVLRLPKGGRLNQAASAAPRR